MGEQKRIEKEDPGDPTARSDAWDFAPWIKQQMNEVSYDRGDQQQKKESASTEVILHIVPEEPEGPHVAYEVEPAPVQKHRGEEGKRIVGGETPPQGPFRIGEPQGNYPVFEEEELKGPGGQGKLEQEDKGI